MYGYTIPSHTHRELEPALLERLIGDGLAGLKDSTKSSERHREYAAAVRAAGAPFALFTGSAGLVLEALSEGSAGAVLALANLHPEPCVALVRAVREGRDDEAVPLQAEMRGARRGAQGGGPDPGAEARRRGAPRPIAASRTGPPSAGRSARSPPVPAA